MNRELSVSARPNESATAGRMVELWQAEKTPDAPEGQFCFARFCKGFTDGSVTHSKRYEVLSNEKSDIRQFDMSKEFITMEAKIQRIQELKKKRIRSLWLIIMYRTEITGYC